MHHNSDKKRPRGILTPADREYLRGETEYEHQQTVSNTNQRIRKRLYDALLDFSLIFEQMDRFDRAQVYRRISEEAEYDGFSSIVAAVAILYEAASKMDTGFEVPVEHGIRQAERQRLAEADGPTPVISVEIDDGGFNVVHRSQTESLVDQVVAKLESGTHIRDLTDAEIRELVEWYSYADEFNPEIAAREYRRSDGLDR